MAAQTHYYPGGYNAAAPAQNKAEQWSNGTLTGDPAAGYTAWNTDGSIATQRALTAAETTALANADTANTQAANQATLQQQGIAAITANATDKSQDQTIISQAATLVTQATTLQSTSITTLAQAQTAIQQLAGGVKQLAQGVSTLAQNDLNTKAELNTILRLLLNQLNATT